MSAGGQGCSTPTKPAAPARVKKEQLAGQPPVAAGHQTRGTMGRLQQQQQRLPPSCVTPSAHPPAPSPSLANGFHSGDLLQDILRGSKLNSLAHHTPAAKHEKIRLMIEDSISQESRSRVQDIFSQVEQLKLEEKLLLYLKLPISLTNPNGTVDPLRQPLNPLGNRYEIHQTIMWIKTHLEEDPEVSLPKQEVYDEYNIFCSKNAMKPLSTADFGKVMKQVYPKVRPRRLGTRGNSRYCYAGMRKRIKLEPPILPPASGTEVGEDAEPNISEEMLGSASILIREWAESLLDAKFPSLCALGKYLVNNLCVDNRSLAAVCILSGSGEAQPVTNKVASPGLSISPASVKTAKLREAQLQLQRKLQEREHTRDQKHRHPNSGSQNQNKEKAGDQNNQGVEVGNKKGKKGKANSNHLAQGTNALNKVNVTVGGSASRQKKVLKSNNQSCSVSLQSNCDNLVVQSTQEEQNSSTPRLVTSDSGVSPKDIKFKYTRKRASVNAAAQASESSPEKQFKHLDGQSSQEGARRSASPGSRLSSTPIQQSTKMPVILANNPKTAKSNKTTGEAVAAHANQPPKSCDKESSLCSNGYSNGSDAGGKASALTKDEIRMLQENSSFVSKDKLGSIDTDALNDYLNGGNNSQEQEEELLQYFQQSNSSSSDAELGVGAGVVGGSAGCVLVETDQASRQDKVSQLRIILQENLKGSVLTAAKPRLQISAMEKQQQQALQKHNLILPSLLSHSNTRRRVSFETSALGDHSQENGSTSNGSASNGSNASGALAHHGNTVPQSPNTRRRIFNFTPISPGPHSPINGRASKSSSANASPFVSPRNTPVPRSRSNLQGCYRSRGSQKSLSRSISCNVACSANRNDPFIVPTSTADLVRHSPLTSHNSKASQAQLAPQEQGQKPAELPCAPFLSDLTSQEPQLLINYPSQENLQEIKNVYQQSKQQPTDQEISDFLQSERQQYTKEQLFYRSQSVPLHRMVDPVLLSPISVHHANSLSLSHSFNPSTNSSVAPTPVPSEFNDFSSIGPCDSNYLLDVDPLAATDSQFLIEDKEIIPESLPNLFDMLNETETEILPAESSVKLENDIADPLPSATINSGILLEESTALLESWSSGARPNALSGGATGSNSKLAHSRSYPNTPLPLPNATFSLQYPDDSNASRSYPTTPLHNLQQPQQQQQQQQQQRQQQSYAESNEPMLFNPNTLNLHSQPSGMSNACSTSVECNVADFLDRDMTNDETDDLGSLGNFEGLQDVDTLSPLFTEVVESNH